MTDIQPTTPIEEKRSRRDRARTATKRYADDFYVGDNWTKSRKFEEAVKRDLSASQSESAEDEETIENIRHLITGSDQIAVGAEEVVQELNMPAPNPMATVQLQPSEISISSFQDKIELSHNEETLGSCANCADSSKTGRVPFSNKIAKSHVTLCDMLNEVYDGTVNYDMSDESLFLCSKCSNELIKIHQALKQVKESAKIFRDRTRRGHYIHDKLKTSEELILRRSSSFQDKLTELRAKQQVAAEMKKMAEHPAPDPIIPKSPEYTKAMKEPPLKVKLPLKKTGYKTRSTQTPKMPKSPLSTHVSPYMIPPTPPIIKHEHSSSAPTFRLKRNAKPWQKRVVRSFARGSYLAAFRKSLENSSKARKAFMDAMAFMIDKEVKAKVESQTGILRQPFNTDVVEGFSWRQLVEELTESLPFLTTAIRASIRVKSMKGRSKDNNRARNKVLCLGSILAQIMFIRNTCCRLVQIANAVMMWYNSCPKMLFRAFNSLGFCLSRESVKQFVSMDQKAIDKRMLKWRKKILYPKKYDSRIHETSTEYVESSSDDDSEEEQQFTEESSEEESESEDESSTEEEEDEHGMIPVKQESIVEERGVYSSHVSHIQHVVSDELIETMNQPMEQTEEAPAPDAEGENQSTKCIIQRIANDPQILEEAVWSIQNDENDVAVAQNLVELSESGQDGDKQIVLVVVPSEEDGSDQVISDGNVVIHIPNNDENAADDQNYLNVQTTESGQNYVQISQEDGQTYVQETCITTDGQTILPHS